MIKRRVLYFRRAFACVLLLSFLGTPRAFVQFASAQAITTAKVPVQTLTLPSNPVNVGSFTAVVSWPDTDAPGYFPIQINVKATTIFSADQQLMFRLTPMRGGHSPPESGIEIEIPISIDQGSKRKTVTRQVPKWSVGSRYKVEVYEDGRRVEFYSGLIGNGITTNWYTPPLAFLTGENRLNFAFVAESKTSKNDRATDSLLMAAIASNADGQDFGAWSAGRINYGYQTSYQMGTDSKFADASVSLISPGQLPTDWRTYQGTDAVLISQDRLGKLHKSQPTQFQAIRDWVMCGGTIVVLNADSMNDAVQVLGVKRQANDASAKRISSSISREVVSRKSQLATLEQTERSLEGTRAYLVKLYRKAIEDREAAEKQKNADEGVAESDSKNADSPSDQNPEPSEEEISEEEISEEEISEEESAEDEASDADLSKDKEAMALTSEFDDQDFENQQLIQLALQQDILANAIPSGSSRAIADLVASGYTLKECVSELAGVRRQIAAFKRPAKVDLLKDQIWMQEVGAGRLVGMHKDCEYTDFTWEILAKTFGFRRSTMLRRGVDPVLGSSRVSDWLIAGVAQPPVYIFIGLLALFMILVGPIAYRRTHRAGRAYLMFAIAPVLAFITTAVMFTYGVMADGFGTKSRIRQLTWVDGKSGDAGERVRSTYFAGVRPSGGLQFPGNAEVIGYKDDNPMTWEELNVRDFAIQGTVVVDEQTQQFDSGFIPSRMQKQFVVHQPREQIGRLTLVANPDGSSPPSVTSTFDFEIREVTLFDQNGIAWIVESVPAKATNVACKEIDQTKFSKRLADQYNKYRPINRNTRSRDYNRQTGYSSETRDLVNVLNRAGSSGGSPGVSEGVFEYPLQIKAKIADKPPPGYFFSIADVSEDAIAIKDAELSDSIRVVFGTLQ